MPVSGHGGAQSYYDDGRVTIYHGDCLDVLPLIAADVLITDPPYGVEMGTAVDPRAGTGAYGLKREAYLSHDDSYATFVAQVVPRINAALALVKRAAVFTGPHLQDQAKADAIGGIYCPAGSGRHSWGFKTFLPILFYGSDPFLTTGQGARPNIFQSTRTAEPNGHPCPKPIEWMRWLVQRAAAPDDVILDPFMGSGSTLRAAKDLGRRVIGIEIEERYCEIAARRMAQEVFDLEGAA